MSATSPTDPPTHLAVPTRGILVRSRSLPSNLAGPEPDNISSSSLPPCPPLPNRSTSISFAPLPSTDPKRSRKPNRRPLGVAGRSSILRQQGRNRQSVYAQQPDEQGDSADSAYPRSHGHMTDDDDALLELGRMMRDAGKRLWRSFSQVKHDDAQRQPSVASVNDSTPEDSRGSDDRGIAPSSPVDDKDDLQHELLYNNPGSPAFSPEDVEMATAFIEYDEPIILDDDEHHDSGYHETVTHNTSTEMQIENPVILRTVPVS